MDYYRTPVTITVLSEGPLDEEMSPAEIAYAIDEGDCVGTVEFGTSEKLSGKAMAEALTAAGSEPEFFQLDPDGDQLDV